VVNGTTRPLYTWERDPIPHCVGGCVGPRVGLYGCEKSRPNLHSESWINSLNYGYFSLLKCDAVWFGIYIYQYFGIDSCFHLETSPIGILNCVFSLQEDMLNIANCTIATSPKIPLYNFVCFGRNSPQWARASTFTRFLYHNDAPQSVGLLWTTSSEIPLPDNR
jgi:hypothetical protein